jgi:hypothetical protein
MNQPGHKQADRVNKGDCCFNHIIGLPTKDRARKLLFDYERILYNALLRPSYLNNKPAYDQ